MNDPHLTDKEMDSVVRTWMEEAPAGQPDRSRVVGTVISKLGTTGRRRRRWPFSMLRGRTGSEAPESDGGPLDPLSSTEPLTPTVTGRTRIMFSPAKASLIGALVFAIGGTFLIAEPFQRDGSVPGAETTVADDGAAMAPALATGRRIFVSASPFTEESESTGLWAQRGRTTNVRSQMSDARLSGDVVIVDNADRSFDGDPSDENYGGDVLWGTIEITNDDGTWTGTGVGTTDTSGGMGNITYYELTGSGGHEGLSAVIFEREGGGWTWDGVIFPGDLPPDRS